MTADVEKLQRYAKTRDASVFAALLAAYGDMVYGTCLRILGNRAEAEDATQECFWRLARESASVRISVGAWLHRCATNECITRQRRRASRSERERLHDAARHAQREEAREWSEVSGAVDQAMDTLPMELRRVVVAHFLERRTQADLARELGVSPATMSRRINEGVEAIRKKLREAGIFAAAAALVMFLGEKTANAAPPRLVMGLGKLALAGPPARGLPPGRRWRRAALGGAGAAAAVAAVLLLTRTLPTRTQTGAAALGPMKQAAAPRMAPAATQAARDPAVDEALYEIRMAVPAAGDPATAVGGPDAWVQALRTLTRKGSAAVPAIVEELRHTRRDDEQRLLCMALRFIGDPRAVPVLIRTLPRTATDRWAYTVTLHEKDSRLFLHQHQWTGARGFDAPLSGLNSGIVECVAALETITHHTEGHDALDTTGDPNDQQAAHERLASRWTNWWNTHAPTFGTAGELIANPPAPAVPPPPGEADWPAGDPVGAAGRRAFGNPFPTGPDVNLTATREVLLQPAATWDALAYLDLDRGRTCRRNENRAPSASTDEPAWEADAGVDITVTPNGSLQGVGIEAWPISNVRFDTIAAEIHSNRVLDLGAWGPGPLVPCDLKTGALRQVNSATPWNGGPATFLVTTRDGGHGIVQIDGAGDQDRDLRIRYRMVVRPVAALPTPAEARPGTWQFGGTNEVALHLPATGRSVAIDFDTATLRPAPPELGAAADLAQWRAWLQQWGGDAICLPGDRPGTLRLDAPTLQQLPVSAAAWNTLSPSDAATILQRAGTASDPAPSPTHTWIFATAAGARGLMQVQTNPNAPTLRLRYKLLNRASPTLP